MLKAGIIGAGHSGVNNARMLDNLSAYLVIGFFESDDNLALEMERETGLLRFTDPDQLIDACDCIHIAAPAKDRFDFAVRSIRKSKHVFIEKTVLRSAEQAKKLMHLASEAGISVQVGYADRFHSAFRAAQCSIHQPLFIEVQRLATVPHEETDISIVSELMLHDIDLVLSMVASNVKRVSANGVRMINNSPDIVNARVEFHNGCVASFTASRIATCSQQTVQVHQHGGLMRIDFLEKKVEVIAQKTLVLPSGMVAADSERSHLQALSVEKLPVRETNPIEEQFRSFAQTIVTGHSPVVSIEDTFRSMELASQISDRLRMAVR